MKNRTSHGFTLVELAIVLVIFTLVVTGVLRGQELINSAKARNLIDQKNSIQAAFFGFTNRYKLTPGDLTQAQAQFIGNTLAYTSASTSGDGKIAFDTESVLLFQNLTATSFLSCSGCMTTTTTAIASSASASVASTVNSPINAYSQSLQFGTVPAASSINAATVYWYDRLLAAVPDRNVLTTGSKVTAAILQQVDQKADDGSPHTGLFRQSTTDSADTTANCVSNSIGGIANTGWNTTGNANCAGAWLF